MTDQPQPPQSDNEREFKKTVVYEHSTKETSRSILPALIVVGILVVALLIFIFTRID